ncbi:GDP-mannose 4,6-dehydratase [Patescibacteria group bacterium]|nr:GDP-mannose 4,6-dehydratase [Patescibacteria group bacterium]MBU1931446.1 GDP-mannose 4,6-dehydratase [Patescibacteria group bacterium]
MPIKAITRHWYKGKIIKLKQKWGVIEATPNHSIYSANLELTNPRSNPELLVVREVNEVRKKHKKTSKDLLKILAAYITEGNATFNKANGGYIVEISQGNKKWLESLGRAIKAEFGFNYCIIRHKKQSYKLVYALQVSNKKFFNYLIKNCGKYCDQKYFPNWIFDLTVEKRQFFWKKLLEGDGTKDGRYSTTSYKLANQLSLLLSLLRKDFRVFESKRGNYKKSWEFKTQLSGQHYGLSQKKKSEIDYEGWVYDLEVEKTHNFVCGIGNIVCHNTHVDRSILEPAEFITTNVVGTQVLLAAALKNKVKRFHHVSTDEVFGSLALDSKEKFNEQTSFAPNSPYAASKAASDHLVRAYFKTYGLAMTITNTSNNFGPYQFPEKLIALAITNLLANKKMPLYGDGLNVRDWLYVDDHCRAIDLCLQKGRVGETYCIGGLTEDISNLQVIKKIIKLLNKDESMIVMIKDRPGHDRRYAVDWSKAKKELGYAPEHDFDTYLQKTVEWYQQNQAWWQRVKSGDYQQYYKEWYGKKLKM